jgi:hypothetical protein
MNQKSTYFRLWPLLFGIILLSACSPSKNSHLPYSKPDLYTGSPSKSALNDFNIALAETKKLFNLSNSDLHFYKYRQSLYRFVDHLESSVRATTTFVGAKPPFISINTTTKLRPTNLIHETMHRLSPYIVRLLQNGDLAHFMPKSSYGLSTYVIGSASSEKYLNHYFNGKTPLDRYEFFKKRFLKIDYLGINNDFKIASAHMVASILSDELLHIDSKYYLEGLKDNYIFSPEELLARALSIYYIMSNTPNNLRFVGEGLQGKDIKSPLSKEKWASVFPNSAFNSFTAYSIKKEFNPAIQGFPRISSSTFDAIKDWLALIPSMKIEK